MKEISRSDVRGVTPRGKPRMGSMDNVQRALDTKVMPGEQGRVVVRDRN